MTGRLATICCATMFVIGLATPFAQAQSRRSASLKGISALTVLVEELPYSAKNLGLTDDAIQTDVELKLRLGGLRVVTQGEALAVPGMPTVYIRITVTDDARAASIEVELDQNALLERNQEPVVGVGTWQKAVLVSNPSAQGIRNTVKDLLDRFLNDWLSVNPKK
jgi:hypothetical protein